VDHATEYSIRRLIHRCADLQDQGRVTEIAALFRHAEIVLAGVGQVFRGEVGALEILKRTIFYDANGEPADPVLVYATPRTVQYVTNIDVYVGGDGEPCATSRFMIVRQTDRGPQPIMGGRYVDAFCRIDDAFWFRRRVAEAHLVGDSAGSLTSNPWIV
jgi:hypothetical protein